MLAILLAGGEGERLRPLTCTLPKPMALIAGQPILAHTLNLLKKHGVTDIAMTLGYLPEKIMDEFSDGEDYGVKIRYYTENTPLGTAGSVKRAADFLTETFLVISGDALTDADLTEAYAFHKEKHASATMILKRVSDPTSYGLVNTDETGRVTSFLEKPSWQQVNTDNANTGIYILEPEVLAKIPDTGMYDFGKQLFPLLVQEGFPVYGYLTDRYWCDIGDISAYLRANGDALSGKVGVIDAPDNRIRRMSGAIIDEHAHLEAPVYIGAHARIDKGAFIGAGSVIGDYAHIGENASVKRSIVYPAAKVGCGAQLRACIVSAGVKVSESACLYEESVVGADSIVERRACIRPGVKIWPGKRVFEGAEISDNMIWGQRSKRYFSGFTLNCETPEECARIARTIAWKTGVQNALVGRSVGAVSASQERAFVSGLLAGGVQVYLLGECTLPAVRFILKNTVADSAFFLTGTDIFPVSKSLLPLAEGFRKTIEASLSRQDAPPPYTGYTKRAESAGRFDLAYLSFLESAYTSALRKNSCVVYAASEPLSYLAERVFSHLSIPARIEWEEDMMEIGEDEIGIYLSADGQSVRFADRDGLLNDAENEILLAKAISFLGEHILHAPPTATHALSDMPFENKAEMIYHTDEYKWLEQMRSDSETQFFMRTDALYGAIAVLAYLAENQKTMNEFRSSLPSVFRASCEIPVSEDERAHTLRRFRETLPEEFKTEEWYFEKKHAGAWLTPSETRPVLTLTTEAATLSDANDMLKTISDLIEKAKQNRTP